MKLQTVSNNFGMASVCSVPFQYIFTRGQGVKTFSLVSRECARRDYRIPQRRADGIVPANLPPEEQDAIFEKGFPQDKGEPPATKETYQGAFVLDPKPGIYLDEAIAVLDYSSLVSGVWCVCLLGVLADFVSFVCSTHRPKSATTSARRPLCSTPSIWATRAARS